jgi:shikimate dehydrogenase
MEIYGLIGKKLNYSFSRTFFENLFASKGIVAEYSNFELETIDKIKEVFALHPSGLNVTIPYKEAIIPYLDDLSPESKEIGAVNVVQFKGKKKIGHNTDAYGFHQSIKPFLTNKHERAMILGTGGASKAVAHVFKKIGIDVIFISRNPIGPKEFPYEAINEHMVNACKVVVNCTPIGTFPAVEESVLFPYQHLTSDHLVVDLIYNPEKTKFLEFSEEYGATILNGETMLKEQALKAWSIWQEGKQYFPFRQLKIDN